MGILEKIKEIEDEMARTQKNKRTCVPRDVVGFRIPSWAVKGETGQIQDAATGVRFSGAWLISNNIHTEQRQPLNIRPDSKGGQKGEGFDVMKSGDARCALIGFPSVGKSTLLSKLTGTESIAAAYEFTTLTCIPGKIRYQGSDIQLLDLPGIIEGAAQGKGRGRQVIAVAKTSDLIIMVLDATKHEKQRELLEKELEAVGIRLNRQKPNVYFKVKKAGGISFNATCKLNYLDEKLCYNILHDYRIHNADVLVREDVTVDEFIDVVLGTRRYLPCLYVYNKIDAVSLETVDALARQPNTVVISCELDLNMEYLLERIWKDLNLVRIYTKKKGAFPDLSECIILRNGATIEHVCHRIHRSLVGDFKYALVWGRSSKHNPQRAGLTHVVEDEDVVQIMKKK